MSTVRTPPPYPFVAGPRESGRCRIIHRAVGGWWLSNENIVEWFPQGSGFRYRLLDMKAERPGDLMSGVYQHGDDTVACAPE